MPAVLLVGAIVWQLALTGHTAWLCANAARVGARAEVVGRDPEAAARSALPAGLERGVRVGRDEEGRIRVSVRVPLLLHHWRGPVDIAAAAALERTP